MAGPFQHGSSGYSDPASPVSSSTIPAPSSSRRRHPSSDIPSLANFYSHPSRTSLLNSAGDLNLGSSVNYGNSAQNDNGDWEESPLGGFPRAWRNAGLPSFSRAFNILMSTDGADDSSPNEDGFFVPSYLEGSTYAKKLEEAHKSRMQGQRDSKRSNGGSGQTTAPSPFFNALPPGSHRGMSHTVHERPPPFEEEETVAPLPTKWNKDDQWGGIEIQADTLSIKHVGLKGQQDREHEASAARADHYMPAQCGIYYYEVQILSAKSNDATIGIGFSTRSATLSRPVGWEPESWGYHGDDGRCFTGQNIGRAYGPQFNTGDVVGCGVNFRDNTAFFTKNGVKIADAFRDVARGKMFPTISLKKPGECVRANFGQAPFVYNIDDMMKDERARVFKDIQSTDTSSLVTTKMNEADLVQQLVLQFLQHDGYVDSARAFAEDIKIQKEALNMDPNVKIEGINIKDDEDADKRQRIRQAILEGDVDRALKHTSAYYPSVLMENEQVHFKLRCRKFIEMVRKAAQVHMTDDSQRSNGYEPTSGHQDMDLDMNGDEGTGWSGQVDDENGTPPLSPVSELEREMLVYGQQLQTEYAHDTRKEVTKTLEEIWALVAYKNPLKEPRVSHLLDRKGRVAVAEELNSAILLSLGKSSRAALENLYAQTSVLLDELRQDGSDAAFISIQDVIDEIPRSTQV